MAPRKVVLTEHQDELIAALVKDGRYQNASEVLVPVCGSSNSRSESTKQR